MNSKIVELLTNPFVIGGTALGTGIVTGAVIYAKKRPKTDKEIELLKLKEQNAEEERKRKADIRLKEIEAKKAVDEVEAKARQEEITKREQIAFEKMKEMNAEAQRKRDWEKDMPAEYWQYKSSEARAAGEEAAAKRTADLQRDIARMQADSAKYAADRNAEANKDREYYSYLKQDSNNQAASQNMQTMFGSLASMVTGKVD